MTNALLRERLSFGAGSGEPIAAEFEPFGVPFEEKSERSRATLSRLVEALRRGELAHQHRPAASRRWRTSAHQRTQLLLLDLMHRLANEIAGPLGMAALRMKTGAAR